MLRTTPSISTIFSSKKSIKRALIHTALAAFIGSTLSGCLSSGTDSDAATDDGGTTLPNSNGVSITGVAVKGILAGAIVEAYDISGTTKLAETTTDSKGKYTLPKFEHDGPILVKLRTSTATKATCDGAKGCKDSSGTTVAFGAKYDFNDAEFDLSAVLPSAALASEQELMVTPITHMAAARVQAAAVKNGGKISSAEVTGLNRATATLLGLDGIDINKIAPVDITDAAATNLGSGAAKLYGALVASIQTLAENNPNTTIANVIDNLAADYATSGGMVSKSATADTISLEKIFSGAIEVVAAAEVKAASENIALDLDEAETQLDTDQSEAENAEPDVVDVAEPEVVNPEDVEPETALTQAKAAQMGIDLLLDLNAWEDALTADQNQTLSQPFFDQLDGTDAILTSINDLSSLMRGFAQLIGEEHEVTECEWYTSDEGCLASYTYSEFESGPVLQVVGVIGSLAQLANEIQNQEAVVSGSFAYTAQLDSANSINIPSLTDILSVEDEASDTSTLAYDLNATFTIVESKISTITFVMDSTEAAYPDGFTITLTQNNFDDASNKISYAVSASSISLASEGIELSIPQGTADAPKGIATMTFASAIDRKAFSAASAGEVGDPSWAKLTAIDVHFETAGTVEETSATLLVDFDYDYNASAIDTPNTTTRLALGIVATNDNNEEISGKFNLVANGNFSESAIASNFFKQTLNLKDAHANFTGKVINAATETDGTLHMAEFNGSIDAGMDFFSPAEAVADADQLIDKAIAEIKGSVFVSTTLVGGEKSRVGFAGSAEVTLALVKTPEGVPFKLQDMEQYHVSKMKLFGRISASQDIDATTNIADRFASLAINAVVNADIAGLQFNQTNFPNNGEVVAQLKYGIKSIDADHAEAFVNRTQAIDDAKTAMTARGVSAISNQGDIDNIRASFSRENCYTPANNSYELCDITAVESREYYTYFLTVLTPSEALSQVASTFENSYNPFGEPLVPAIATELAVSGGAAVIDHSSCIGDLAVDQFSATCNVQRSYTATVLFPNDITDSFSRQTYLRDRDAPLNDGYNSYRYEIDPNCSSDTCTVTLRDTKTVSFPAGLTDTERDTYFADVENGYVNRTSNFTLNSCQTYEDGSMSCSFEQVITHIHNSAANFLDRGLTKFVALATQVQGINDVYLNTWMNSDFGSFYLATGYRMAATTFTGDIEIGTTEEQMIPLILEDFEPQFDAELLATGEGAFVQVSANITIKANLTGLDNAKVSVFINRLGEDDAEGKIKLTNGNRVIELNLNSSEMLTNGLVNNMIIRNADAEMKLILSCATDENDNGIHDNDNITACADGINMQGDIFVGDFKVANLEDRDGFPVFNFTDGSGYDLIVTPNFVVQPSVQ